MGKLLILFAIALFLIESNRSSDSTNYDKYCSLIQHHGSLAPKFHKKGQIEEAYKEIDKAGEAFLKAIEIDDNDPQAYLDYGILMTNIHKFEESIELIEKAKERSPVHYHNMIDKRLLHAKLGLVSTRRDQHNNNGELIMASYYASSQYNLTNHPSYLFDLGMIFVQIAEIIPHKWKEAVTILNTAQSETFDNYVKSQIEKSKSKQSKTNPVIQEKACQLIREPNVNQNGEYSFLNGEDILHDLKILENQATEERYGDGSVSFSQSGSSYIILELSNTELHGNSGVIFQKKRCQLFTGSGSSFINLLESLQPRNKGGMMKRIPFAFSILQYYGNTYYHWMMEGVGRLILLTPLIKKLANYPIIVPKGFLSQPFIKYIISTYFPLDIQNRFIEYTNGIWVVDTLIVVDWNSPKVDYINWSITETQLFKLEEEREIEIKKSLPRQNAHLSWLLEQGGIHDHANEEKENVDMNRNTHLALHCVAPKVVITAISKLFQSIIPQTEKEYCEPTELIKCNANIEDEQYVIYLSRRNMKRSLDQEIESLLINKIMNKLSNGPEVEPRDKDSKKLLVLGPDDMGDISKIQSLFHSAHTIIGLHGGALSNIIFCKKGTRIIELGFRTPASYHYHHAAIALDLPYRKYLLEPRESAMNSDVLFLSNYTINDIVEFI